MIVEAILFLGIKQGNLWFYWCLSPLFIGYSLPTGEYSLIHELFFGRVKINAGEGNAKLLGMKSVSQMTKVALVSLIWPNETKTYLRSSSSNSIALPPHRGLIGSVRIMGGMTTLILATTLWPLLLCGRIYTCATAVIQSAETRVSIGNGPMIVFWADL